MVAYLKAINLTFTKENSYIKLTNTCRFRNYASRIDLRTLKYQNQVYTHPYRSI